MKVGPHTILSVQDEKALLSFYKVMQKQGYGKIKEMIMHMAGKITRKNGYNAGEAFPNETWWQSFCSRHNVPVTLESNEVFGVPKQQINEVILNKCYQQLLETLVSNRYEINFLDHPELIYSCNENNFLLDRLNCILSCNMQPENRQPDLINHDLDEHVSKIPVAPKAERDSSSKVELADSGLSATGSCSVITCANASGQSLPPMFIHSKSIADSQFNTSDGIVEKVTNRRLDQDFFLIWFHEIFLKNTPRSGPLVLLYDGSNCFLTKDILMAAAMNDVVLLCIPAALSHILQPLDLSLDGIFSASWQNFNFSALGTSSISHVNFSQVFIAVWSTMISSSVITDRFKEVGIYPFLRQNVTILGLEDVTERNNQFSAAKKDSNDTQKHARELTISSKVGCLEKSLDTNQNFMRHAGIITRPTMSNLNQPLTDIPVVTQIITEEDGYTNDFSDAYQEPASADEVSSSSDDGSPNIVSVNTTLSPNATLSRSSLEGHSSFVRSPTMTASQQNQNSYLAYQNHKIMPIKKYSVLASPQVKQSPNNNNNNNRETKASGHTLKNGSESPSPSNSSRPMRHSPRAFLSPPSSAFAASLVQAPPRNQFSNLQILASLNALEELLDHRKISKFQKAYDSRQENTMDLDPLYPVWKSLRVRSVAPLNSARSSVQPHLQPNVQPHLQPHVQPLVQPHVPPHVNPASTSVYDTPVSTNHKETKPFPCSCMDEYRTIVTPAGNLSVNRKATVVVIMPEKTTDTNDEGCSAEAGSWRGQEILASTHS